MPVATMLLDRSGFKVEARKLSVSIMLLSNLHFDGCLEIEFGVLFEC